MIHKVGFVFAFLDHFIRKLLQDVNLSQNVKVICHINLDSREIILEPLRFFFKSCANALKPV
jgi:hypothetical protein